MIEIESMNVYITPIRVSKEFMFMINKFKAKCMLEGKKVPTNPQITKTVAKMIGYEEIWNEFY